MKTSFSTLACPDFSWQDIYSMAKDFGFDGIEIRGLGKDIFSVQAPPFRDENIDATVAKLKKLKLEISCLSSGAVLNDPANEAQAIDEVTAYVVKVAGQAVGVGEYTCYSKFPEGVGTLELVTVLLIAWTKLSETVLHGVLPVGRYYAVEGEA